VVELLQQMTSKIQPPPQRVIWLYKRWQKLYDVIKNTVPNVEFMKGIPINLDSDDFIDPQRCNIIVLDDMAAEIAKDDRVTSLFTEGSHHRNLSVIALNQNLFMSKDPTQRRNCHYIVLFNNPVDKQLIATLARQMYPSKPKELIRQFDNAVSRPYGYLLLDLKPNTRESLRMRTDVLNSINTLESEPEIHLTEDIPAIKTCFEDKLPDSIIEDNTENLTKMPSCDDCGVVIENVHDLQNHVKKWCPATHSEESENVSVKRRRLLDGDIFEVDSNESVNKQDAQEHEVYELFANLAKQRYEKAWSKKVEKYQNQGLSASEAHEKADAKMKTLELNDFIQRYGTYISQILKLRGGVLHTEIMTSIEEFVDRGMDRDRAIRLSLRKHSHQFEDYLDAEKESDESEMEEGEESENETDDDSEME